MKHLIASAAMVAGIAAAQVQPLPMPELRPVHIDNPLDLSRKAQEIRNMQLQNLQLQQEIEARAAHSAKEKAAPSLSASAGELTTGGFVNCRGWGLSQEAQQLTYVAGVRDATMLSLYEFEKSADLAKYVPLTVNNGEVRLLVGSLCSEPENRGVPVLFMLRLVAAKTNGTPPDQVEFQLASYRKIAAALLAPAK